MENNKKLIIIITTIIIFLIIAVIMSFTFKDNKNNLDQAIQKWYDLNQDLFIDNNIISFKAYVLKDLDLISNNTKYKDKCLTNDSIIVARKNSGAVSYEIKYIQESDCDYNEANDYIYLIGKNEISIDQGFEYKDLGAIAKNKNGDIISVETIGNNYKINKKGTFNVEYNTKDGSDLTKIKRTIKVTENVEPKIDINIK